MRLLTYKLCLATVVLIGITGCQTLNYPPGAPRIASHFGSTLDAVGRTRIKPHSGIDILGGYGQEILAAADGIVLDVVVDPCAGPRIVINHGKTKDGKPLLGIYTHLGEMLVSENEMVFRGEVIAKLGNNHHQFSCVAGVRHLHFSVAQGYVDFYGISKIGTSNPNLYWADGPYNITCFEEGRKYESGTLTYPVPCD